MKQGQTRCYSKWSLSLCWTCHFFVTKVGTTTVRSTGLSPLILDLVESVAYAVICISSGWLVPAGRWTLIAPSCFSLAPFISWRCLMPALPQIRRATALLFLHYQNKYDLRRSQLRIPITDLVYIMRNSFILPTSNLLLRFPESEGV